MSARASWFALLALAAAAAPAHAGLDSLAGHWEGAYGRLGSVQIVRVDLEARGDSLGGTYDIPELGLAAEPLREVRASAAGLTLRLTYGAFELRISPGGAQMTGVNARWNPPLTLHLKRAERPAVVPLPAEPFAFAHGGVRLAGTLVRPAGPGPHPAIVIVHGSGAEGRASGFYRQWGDWFARRGIAALIYDKRGVGESGGDFETATFEDLAGDVRAAADALRARRDVDARRIGLFGISQGGWIAPLAASRGAGVAFMIMHVGPAVTVREQELHRVEYSMRADEAAEADIAAALAYVREVFDAAYTGAGAAALLARAEAAATAPWADYVDVIRGNADLEGWRRIRYDPAPVLFRTRVPLLALYGEHDVLVPPAENAARLRAALERAGNRDVTIRVIPGANHDMETFGTLRGGEWNWPDGFWVWPRRAPGFEATIAAWLRERGLGW